MELQQAAPPTTIPPGSVSSTFAFKFRIRRGLVVEIPTSYGPKYLQANWSYNINPPAASSITRTAGSVIQIPFDPRNHCRKNDGSIPVVGPLTLHRDSKSGQLFYYCSVLSSIECTRYCICRRQRSYRRRSVTSKASSLLALDNPGCERKITRVPMRAVTIEYIWIPDG